MTIYLKDFLKDDSPAAAIARAINALSDGDTLALGGGKISLSPEGALRKYYCISNNDKGEKDNGRRRGHRTCFFGRYSPLCDRRVRKCHREKLLGRLRKPALRAGKDRRSR